MYKPHTKTFIIIIFITLLSLIGCFVVKKVEAACSTFKTPTHFSPAQIQYLEETEYIQDHINTPVLMFLYVPGGVLGSAEEKKYYKEEKSYVHCFLDVGFLVKEANRGKTNA